MIKNNNKKILLIENLSVDFYSARLSYAHYLKSIGWDVYACVPSGSSYNFKIQEVGINVLEFDFVRGNKGLFQIISLVKIYRNFFISHQFDVVHSFRFGPNLFNVLAGVGLRHKTILHITGLGIAFSRNSFYYFFLRLISQFIFFIKLFIADKIIVQNSEDKRDIWANFVFKNKIQVINGSGVDTEKFNPAYYDKEKLRNEFGLRTNHKVFICVSRLIWEKGIKELTVAFSELYLKNQDFRLLIVGCPDFENPRHVDNDFISSFGQNPCIKFLGSRTDIPHLLAMSDYCIYPSYYREGIPRSLLEGLSMALPIITTDMPGCNLSVKHKINGLLINPRSVIEIVAAVEDLITLSSKDMGLNSRLHAISTFDKNLIFYQIQKVYQ